MTQNSTSSELLTVQEVASYLRVDATTVRRWIKDGLLEAALMPGHASRHTYRISRAVIEQIATPHYEARDLGEVNGNVRSHR